MQFSSVLNLREIVTNRRRMLAAASAKSSYGANLVPHVPRIMRAVVVIAGNANYFYNTFGERIAEALRNLGASVDIATLHTFEPQDYDCCCLVGLGEIVAGHNDRQVALRRLAEIQACSKLTTVWNFDSMATCWFANTQNLLRQVKFDVLVDTNIHDQHWLVPNELRAKHLFVFYGLTRQEREQLHSDRQNGLYENEQRSIPWVMVGHATESRIALAERLVKEVHPSGFLYLPYLSPVTENGPHLNQRQYQTVLRHCRFHVWCCHHETFYVEGERFRAAALHGCVPIKVSRQPPPPGLIVPFPFLILPEADFTSRLRSMDFSEARRRFLDEFDRLPSLESELVRLFDELRATGQIHAELMQFRREA
jgi:hypothetical protein